MRERAGVEVADGLLTVDQKKKESWGQLVNVFSLRHVGDNLRRSPFSAHRRLKVSETVRQP